ncbi:MAG: S-layer homology domain-containing protein, partial [Actinomycetota bacterium]|nr:S-layer homology domain-containing protein [Actinomycetota bacterium]
LHGYSQPDEAWFRYWMRFEGLPEDTGKLPGFMALYSDSARGRIPPSESQPGWSARVLFGPGDGGTNVRLGYYLYWLGQSQSYGDALWWSQQAPLGEWVCVEGHVAMNTPGTRDGELDAWMNGDQVFHRDDILYRSSSQASVHIRDFMFEVYYGGSSTPPRDTPVSFDELVVADQRVGCGDSEPRSSFEDTVGSPFVEDIEWLAAEGITKGCNPVANTRFCPNEAVTRGQMAAFLHRALNDFVDVPPPPPPPPDPPSAWGVEVADYEAALSTMNAKGEPLDMMHVEYPLSGGDWLAGGASSYSGWVPKQLSKIRDGGSVPYIEFYDTDISGFNAGRYDREFAAWVDIITGWLDESPENRLLIVPFPDANNKNVSYGDSTGAFTTAYRKVHDAVLDTGVNGSQVRFVYQMSAELNSDRYAKATVGTGYGAYSPGAAYIDLAAISWLNDGVPTWDDWSSVFKARVGEMNQQVGDDVPVLMGMVGSAPSAAGGDRTEWFADLASGIESSSTAIGFVYLDKDRSVAYGVGTESSPEPALMSALATIDSPGDRLDWVFNDLDDWKRDVRASSLVGLFSDDDESVFEADITWLARSGITRGCGDGIYCPDQRVTRGQMAAFLHRALDGTVTPTGSPGTFSDVGDSPFASDIAWLAATGITKGCNPPANDRFCPDASVTRGQMAAFLHRALGGLLR